MQTIVEIKPLKPGKVEAYRDFAAAITGPKKKEYADMLKRYGLKTANVYFHKIRDVDFVIVVHLAEDDAMERLQHFATSTHSMEQWCLEQLNELHDSTPLNGAPYAPQAVFAFNVAENL